MADKSANGAPGWQVFMPEIVAFLLLAAGLLVNAASFSIDPYAELFHLEAAKENVFTGRFWVPVLQGGDYLVRAPLWTWIVTLSFKLFGVGLWAARIPAILLAMAAVWLTYMTAGMLFQNRMMAFFSAVVLGSCWGFFHQAGLSTADIGASCLMLAYTMLFAQWIPMAGRRYVVASEMKIYSVLFGALAGLMLLLKGSLMVLVMAVIGLLYLVMTRSTKALESISWPVLLGVAALFPLPWLAGVAVSQGNSGVILDYLLVQPFQQVTGRGLWAALNGDPLFYARRLLVNFLPYVLFLLAFVFDTAVRRKADAATRNWLLWLTLWFVTGFVMLSLSNYQEPGAMVVFYPALAMLTGFYLGRAMEMGETSRLYNAATGVYIVTLMLLAVLLTIFIFQVVPDDYVSDYWQLPGIALLSILEMEPIPVWKLWLLPAPFILIAGGTVLYFMFENRRLHMAGLALMATTLIFLVFVKAIYLPVLHRPVSQTIAAKLNRQARQPARILIYSIHPDLKRVLFYIDPALVSGVRFVTDPDTLHDYILSAGPDTHVYGVMREVSYYNLEPAVRERLRIEEAGWKVDLNKVGELARILRGHMPLFHRMRTRLILFEALPPVQSEPARIDIEVSP